MALLYDKKAYNLLKKCSDDYRGGMQEWNDYRKETSNVPINLRFSDLTSFKLNNANLKNIDFRGADLFWTSFDESDIENSNFSQTFYWKTYLLVILSAFIFAWLGIDFKNVMTNISSVTAISFGMFFILTFIFGWNPKISIPTIFYIYFIIICGIAIGFYIGNITTITPIVFGVVMAIIIFSILFFRFNVLYTGIQKRIASAKNPEKAIGFDSKYRKDTTSLSSHLDKEIITMKELLDKEKDETEKDILEKKLKEIQEEKEVYLKNEAHTKTQQIKIHNTLNHILRPYGYIEINISKLRKHNYFFYGLIVILLSVFVYALLDKYLDTRSSQFLTVLEKKEVSFGAIFGVILFYATPILFGMSIIVYAITQINKNIQNIESMQEQRRSIEVLQSTLLAQTEISDVSDDDIKALTQALQKGALEKMFGQEKAKENSAKESSSYREKLMVNNLSKVLTQALKSPK